MIFKTWKTPEEASKDFLENEKQFHLGQIPTEQSSPITKNLSFVAQKSTEAGVINIFDADKYIAPKAAEAFKTKEFKKMIKCMKKAVDNKKKIVFSSVGASGRMAVQLDSGWREFWQNLGLKLPMRAKEFLEIADVTDSFITGGDRALIRSVENYEDYMTFGARQVDEANIGKGDVLVGLAECGLSASINGSVLEGIEKGCTTFYIYCNPKEILCKLLDRCRVVFEEEKIIKIPLFVGNMAVAGSTRMQVPTVELLTVGAALEVVANQWLEENLTEQELVAIAPRALKLGKYAKEFDKIEKQFRKPKTLKGLVDFVDLETDTYKKGGLITYAADFCQVDILTDTTERQPTFTLPPYKKIDVDTTNISWAFCKNPLYPSEVTWQHVFRRPIKGLEWTKQDYIDMKADQDIINQPPLVSGSEVQKYYIGNETDKSRFSRKPNVLVMVDVNGQLGHKAFEWFAEQSKNFDRAVLVRMGKIYKGRLWKDEIKIPVKVPETCTNILTHVTVKLCFNMLSTCSMAKMGRIWGNWMIQVLPTNKKLFDRSTRIIANIAGISYEKANLEMFKTFYARQPKDEYKESYVVETLKRLGHDPKDALL
ncbi:MAG: hypothetical protein WCR33_01040 [Bacilli bacterium]